jgi:elongation factor Ts
MREISHREMPFCTEIIEENTMADITAALVKELRERTGAGMMDCKKALVESDGDIELAIENMRKSGAIKAAKKAGNVAADGVIKTKIEGNYGLILEVNCQTDFVAKDGGFQSFAEKVLDVAFAGKITDVEVLKAQFEEERVALVAKIGENINIRRIASLEGDVLGSYLHGARIGVLVAAKGANEELVKQIAMHIAASKPEFVKPEDVSADVVEKEYQVQLDIAMQSGKPKEIAEKMVEGRMKKFTGEVSLTGQPFVIEPSKTVGQVLKEHNADVINFIRFEVGEGIAKAETDFAAEVAAMTKQS